MTEHFASETEYFTTISKRLIENCIQVCKAVATTAEKAGSTVFGKHLEDLSAAVRLVGRVTAFAKPIANFVVPFHYTQAMEVLDNLKTLRSPKLQVKIQEAVFSWNELKAFHDENYTNETRLNLRQNVQNKYSKAKSPLPGLSNLNQKRQESKSLKRADHSKSPERAGSPQKNQLLQPYDFLKTGTGSSAVPRNEDI